VRAHEEKQLRALVAAMPQIVWIADSAGSAEYFNARWYDYTGQREQESLGGSWSDAIHPDDLPGVVSEWNVSVRLGIPYEAEYRIRNLDGRYQWFVVRALPERDSRGHVVRWFGTCTDVDAQHAHLESVQRVADAFAQAQLPEQLPSTPLVVFDATYLPAEDVAQVGGDWYDAFALDQHRFFFSVGDVTGHGLAAALTMSRVRQAIVAFASVENDPASILERTNRVLSMHKETMVTALCGTFDARTGVLQYASAGHPPSIVLGCDGQIREVSSHAPPLGVLERIHVTSCAECLEPGERLICYTDGIIENDRDVVGGEEYLHRVLRSLTPFEGGEPARAIRERVLGGRRGRDDIAILVLSRLDPAGVSLAARDSHVASSKG
jgi:PAS domain S-box-containing protein